MNMNPGGESWKDRIREEREQDALPYLPAVPPPDIRDRLDLLADQLGLPRPNWIDPRHPSQCQPCEIEDLLVHYDPVAEAERLLYETGEN